MLWNGKEIMEATIGGGLIKGLLVGSWVMIVGTRNPLSQFISIVLLIITLLLTDLNPEASSRAFGLGLRVLGLGFGLQSCKAPPQKPLPQGVWGFFLGDVFPKP